MGKQKDVTYILYNNLPHPLLPLTYLLMLSHSLENLNWSHSHEIRSSYCILPNVIRKK